MSKQAIQQPASGPTVRKAPVRRTLRRHTEAQIDIAVEHYERGDSAETIEADLGIPASTVYYHLERRDIARRPCAVPYKHPVPEERVCARKGCDERFTPTGYQAAQPGGGRFCSRECHYAARQVAEPEERVCARKGCKVRFTPYPSEAVRPGHGQFCSARCRGLAWWDVEDNVAPFVASLEARGLFKTRAKRKWGGAWSAKQKGRVAGKRPFEEIYPEDGARVLELRSAGETIRGIAAATGLTKREVEGVIARAALSP